MRNDEALQAAAMAMTGPARIGAYLSLDVDDDFTDITLARHVSDGLPPKSIEFLVTYFGKATVVGAIIPETSYRRAVKKKALLGREHSERLYEMVRVLDALMRIYKDDTRRIVRFMTTAHPMLEGQTPFDVARSSSAGADAVLNLIESAEASFAL